MEETLYFLELLPLAAAVAVSLPLVGMEAQAAVVGHLAVPQEAHLHKQQLMTDTHLLAGVMLAVKAVVALQIRAVAVVAREPLV